MQAMIADGHQWLGYATFLALVGSVVLSVVRGRSGAPYQDGVPRLVGLLLALQVVFGLVLYGIGEYWTAGAALAYGHPVAMVAAVGATGAATARARRNVEAGADGWIQITRLHGVSLLLVLLGIGLASA